MMMTNAVICLNDRKRAREIAISAGRGYLVTMVNMYRDTMPKSADAITWPGRRSTCLRAATSSSTSPSTPGLMLVGTPEEVCASRSRVSDRRLRPARVRHQRRHVARREPSR
ncbi:hypothetical protein ACU686_44515 [Yinghuangia aomiensis]